MFICLCKGITDHQIRQLVQDGAESLRDVRNALGVMTQCGRCACETRALVRETLQEKAAAVQFYSAVA